MTERTASAPREETILLTEKVLGFHKLFYVDLKKNQRGCFLKITEKDGRFRSTVIIPEEALEAFGTVVNRIVGQFLAGNVPGASNAMPAPPVAGEPAPPAAPDTPPAPPPDVDTSPAA
jgi:hypothetical protein